MSAAHSNAPLRCAAYARYSTDKQNPLSTEDQFRKCRQYAESRGWHLLETQLYSDEEISGAILRRPGLDALLSVAESPARPFDAVIFEDTSRLSRKQADVLNLCERLSFAGVRVCFIAQGVDSDERTFQLLVMARGMIDQLFLSDTATRVSRGMEGNLARGLHTGGRCFGYRTDGPENEKRVIIEPREADTIRKIFSAYAAGDSLKTIAKRFNATGVPSPMPGDRRVRHASWSPGALWVILRNERYCGLAVWNKTRSVRNPKTGRRVYRDRPRSEWKTAPAPHLRIVSDELWSAVQARLAAMRARARPGSRTGLCGRALSQRYLLSGLLKCGLCGSNLVLVGGGGPRPNGAPYRTRYGCPLHHERGVCKNPVRIAREELEARVLAIVQRRLTPEYIAFAIEEFSRQLRARLRSTRTRMARLRRRREELKREAANLAAVAARVGPQPELLAKLTATQREIDLINEDEIVGDMRGEARGEARDSLDTQLAGIENFVRQGLRDLRALLIAFAGTTSDVSRAKADLARHLGAVTVTPQSDSSYILSGSFSLLGAQHETQLRTVNGGGQKPTVRMAALLRLVPLVSHFREAA